VEIKKTEVGIFSEHSVKVVLAVESFAPTSPKVCPWVIFGELPAMAADK